MISRQVLLQVLLQQEAASASRDGAREDLVLQVDAEIVSLQSADGTKGLTADIANRDGHGRGLRFEGGGGGG